MVLKIELLETVLRSSSTNYNSRKRGNNPDAHQLNPWVNKIHIHTVGILLDNKK